jgi:nicotinamidase-related amidase
MLCPEVRAQLESIDAKTAVLYGIETHICVLQTAKDLREAGY